MALPKGGGSGLARCHSPFRAGGVCRAGRFAGGPADRYSHYSIERHKCKKASTQNGWKRKNFGSGEGGAGESIAGAAIRKESRGRHRRKEGRRGAQKREGAARGKAQRGAAAGKRRKWGRQGACPQPSSHSINSRAAPSPPFLLLTNWHSALTASTASAGQPRTAQSRMQGRSIMSSPI